jgi:hypothetical protein
METDEIALPEGNKRPADDGADDSEAADRPAKKSRAEGEEQQQEQQQDEPVEPAADGAAAAAAAASDQPQQPPESNEEPTDAAATAPATAEGADAAQHEALPTTPSKASAAAAAAAAAAGAPHDSKATPSPGPQHKPARLGDVVYRVLVPARAVSIVIGKQGCNVRELQSNSGARIQVRGALFAPCCWPWYSSTALRLPIH